MRRNPTFRFDYFLRCLPVDLLGRRCEQLMKAAEKEVEQLERSAREMAGLPLEPEREGEYLPPVELPPFYVMQQKRRLTQMTKAEKERMELEEKVAEIAAQIRVAQDRLKALNGGASAVRVSPIPEDGTFARGEALSAAKDKVLAGGNVSGDKDDMDGDQGAVGPDGTYVEFPSYDGSEPPTEWKKAFTQYCNNTRKELKASLDPKDRTNKVRLLVSRFPGCFLNYCLSSCIVRAIVPEKGPGPLEKRVDGAPGRRKKHFPRVD